MTLFEKVTDLIKNNSDRVGTGEVLMLRLKEYMPRLATILPGFIKGDQILVFGASGIGKSKLTRHLFVKIPIALSARSNLKPVIILNSLEETPEEVAISFVINYLRERHNISLGYYDLIYPETPHSDELIRKIEEGWNYYRHMEQYLEVVSIHEPFGFYKYVRQKLAQLGTFYMNDTPVSIGDQWNRYQYTDPNTFVIAISDNINIYSATNGRSWYETVKEFSAYYSRQILCMKCGVISVIVQQQVSTKEQLDVRADTFLLEKKLEPSLDSLGDFKISQRDALIVLGLFAPGRYDVIDTHNGWDVKRMKDHYRSIHLLKSRKGVASKMVSCYADLSRDHFEELPQSPNEQVYTNYNL